MPETPSPATVITARPNQLKRMIENATIKANQVLMITGQPGIGKSAICYEMAQKHNYKYYDIRPQLMERVDLMGIPYRDEYNRTSWAAPGFFPATDDPGYHFINIEELSSARPDMLTALHQLIWDRRCGDHYLPVNTRIVACGNRLIDRGHVHRMTTPMNSRMVHVELNTSFEDWTQWAINNDIDSDVLFFLRFNSALFNNFEPQSTEPAFPCPRTWSMLSTIKKELDADPDAATQAFMDETRILYSGTVGHAASNAFTAYLEMKATLPDPMDIIFNPEGAIVPENASAKIAICSSLYNIVDHTNFDAITRYANRLSREFGVFLVDRCVDRIPDLANSVSFVMWSASLNLESSD